MASRRGGLRGRTRNTRRREPGANRECGRVRARTCLEQVHYRRRRIFASLRGDPTNAVSGRLIFRMDDAAAVAQARAGDSEAFRLLVERHSRALFKLAYRMTGNEHDAEDVVQEAFLKAYRSLDRFEERSQVGSWLYRIAANCAFDVLRRRQRRDRPAREPRRRGRARAAGGRAGPRSPGAGRRRAPAPGRGARADERRASGRRSCCATSRGARSRRSSSRSASTRRRSSRACAGRSARRARCSLPLTGAVS